MAYKLQIYIKFNEKSEKKFILIAKFSKFFLLYISLKCNIKICLLDSININYNF